MTRPPTPQEVRAYLNEEGRLQSEFEAALLQVRTEAVAVLLRHHEELDVRDVLAALPADDIWRPLAEAIVQSEDAFRAIRAHEVPG